MKNGWIKLHREIQNHWIYDDAEKFKAWIDILLEVNHSEVKTPIKNELFTCYRGESLKSLGTWAYIFGKNWNKSKVRRFFDLLQNDSMIVLKSERKTTRLKVCNYDLYQDKRNTGETQVKRKRNAGETQTTPNNNDKNVNNDKNEKKTTYAPEPENYIMPDNLLKWAKDNRIPEKALKIHTEMCLNHFQDGKTKRPDWSRSIMKWARRDLDQINHKFAFQDGNKLQVVL